MFENVMKFIFGTVEDDVKTILELEKSIQLNKDEALDLGKDFIPIIDKLSRDSRIMNTFCKSKTNQVEKIDNLTTLGKIDSKLDKAKSEYHQLLGELRKSNQSLEDKIEKLFKKEKVKTFYEAYLQKKTNIENLIKGFSSGLLDYDKLEKCHNFISREKVSEGFIYIYKEDDIIKGEPTEAQKHAGNYKKEKKRLRGLVVSIENKKGSTRSGKSEEGKEWEVTMNNDYGYFNRTLGKDGDHIDVFLSDKPEEGNIYVIDQSNEKGKFDEHKVMMGFKSSEDALKNYKLNYEKNFKVKYSGITEVSEEKLKKWLGVENGGKSKKSKPFSELKKALDSDIEKGGDYSEDQLKEMITEHERLIKILLPHVKMDEKVKKEVKIQIKELEGYKKELSNLVKIEKSIVTIDDEFNIFDEFEPDLYKSEDGFVYDPAYIEKAIGGGGKDISKLTKKVIMITRGGKTFKQTVYVSTEDDKKEIETPIGGELTPEVKGLNVIQYSDKAIFIGGDTYASLDLMRDIKSSIGVGTFNKKLGGWFFPMKYKEEVLGIIYSDVKNKGEDEKAEAIKNQKNALDKGTEINIGEIKGKIEKEVSDSDGIKYNVKTEDGTKLDGVDEKVINTPPETNDKKIAEIENNASAESRVKSEKQLYGIKSVENIQNYSLKEYLGMHGLTDEDIQKVLNSFKKKETKSEAQKRASSGGVKKEYTGNEIEGLTKRQLIGKLVYAHYQAVKKAIESGEELKSETLELYEELKASYSKKRKAMSEETKRKIAEALRKNKVPEVKAEKTANEIPEKEIKKVKDSFEAIDNEEVQKYQAELAALVVEKDETQKKYYDLNKQSRATEDYHIKTQLSSEYRELSPKLDKLSVEIREYQNIVQALTNDGELISVIDKVGVTYDNVPNFINVDTSDIMYNIDNILTTEKPPYIPDIDEEAFRLGSYIFDTIRISEDQYLLATNRYSEHSKVKEGYSIKMGDYDPKGGGFVKLTLDQLVLTQDYYTTKKKAEFKERAAERNRRQEESWDKKDDVNKERWLTQKGMYHGLPAKIKKQVTIDKWDSMTWQEREKIYKPIKKYGAEKLKSSFDERHMAGSFHAMYERFVDPTAQVHLKDGTKLKRGEFSNRGGTRYADPEAMKSWRDFREMLDWKINDINIQREEIGEIRSKALETSYGMINTNDTLKKEFGILVKRQNGDNINPQEVDQLKGAWENVQQTFGKLKENANKDTLKLSHAGKTHMFASKAIGMYVPSYKTIGITAKYGEDQLGFTMGHEVAHWIDGTLGKEKGKRHLSDNFESTAGKIAIAFRANMNEKSKSNYINATHESFARAMEQHHAIQTQGKDVLLAGKDRYITSASYVDLEIYEKQIKPLVEQFLKENKELLKSIGIELFSEESDILEKARTGKYADIPENRRLKRVGQPYGSKAQEEAPKGAKTGKKEEFDTKPKGSIEDQAKTASGSALETAAKEASDPEVRTAAHNEIDRRSKEEAVQEEEIGKDDVKKEELKKEKEPKDSIQEKVEEIKDKILDKNKDIKLDLTSGLKDSFTLNKIIIPKDKRGEGMGTKIMNDIIKYADENKLRIDLTPSIDFGGSSVSRLKNFYKKFGFVENKGKNKDFEISEDMYRAVEEVSKGKEKDKKEEPKKEKETKYSELDTTEKIESEIKRLRGIDTDDIKEITKISDDIQGLLKKRSKLIEDEKSLRKVSFDTYREGYRNLSGQAEEKEKTEFYKNEIKKLKITDDEEAALEQYASKSYEYIRDFLTDSKQYEKDYGKDNLIGGTVNNISNFIKNNKIAEDLSLNRRVSSQNSGGFFEKLDIGDVYEDKSFSSSSLSELSHFGDFNIEILAKKGSKVANIDNQGEYEYLIDKNSKFKVLNKNEGGIIVELL